jgi:UrcA family protein
MELQMAIGRNIAALLIIAACGVTGAEAAPPTDEQVTVQDTPYTIHREVTPRTIGNMSEMEIHKTTASRDVVYSDLDLSKDSDVAVLKDRARAAATDVCRQADRQADVPFSRPLIASPNCVATAKQQAMANVNRIVAEARAGRTVAAN